MLHNVGNAHSTTLSIPEDFRNENALGTR